MTQAKCPSCEASVDSLAEVSFESDRAGELLALCCPSCHAVFGVVKARPVERAVEDAGRQVVSALGRLADRMQPKE